MTMPLGRTTSLRTRPVWSGSLTVSRMPFAMPAMRFSSSLSRSSITSVMRPRAAAMSSAFAARISAQRASKLSAMARSSAFFFSAPAAAMLPIAARVF